MSSQPNLSTGEGRFKDLKVRPPVPAYLPTAGSPLTVDTELYNAIQQAPRKLTQEFTIPIRSGKAWEAPAGSIVKLSTPEGPQVGDLNVWNLHNPRERFWASRTRQLHASHLTTGDRLWSCLPYLRPLLTILSDSLSEYNTDTNGFRCHDLLGTRCDPYINTLLSGGQEYDFHCHSNLVRSVMPWGLGEVDVHDVLNVFQVTGLNPEGRYCMGESPAQKGDSLEFLAETDVLMALSTCPGGDLSAWGFGSDNEAEMIKCCRPLHVQVYELEDKDFLSKTGWTPSVTAPYKGMHGLKPLEGEGRDTVVAR